MGGRTRNSLRLPADFSAKHYRAREWNDTLKVLKDKITSQLSVKVINPNMKKEIRLSNKQL